MVKPSTKISLSFLMIFLFLLVYWIDISNAKVTGACSNCHTMHNSQNGGGMARDGSGVGWNSSNQLTGGTIQNTPMNTLLVTSCVGCHSSTTSSSIINFNGSNIPIVYNTTTPTTPLAGGNFYWVASDSSKGHNVYGIAGVDSTLTTAPGRNVSCSSGTCHYTLATAPNGDNMNKGGCQGCHVYTSHHSDNNWYRYLKGHGDITDTDYATGIKDSDWEFTKSSSDHNYYLGTTASYSVGTALTDTHTITAFCQGCHGKFHGPAASGSGMGSASPWIRHPTDIALPTTGEYGSYDPTVNYNTEAPVAWLDPSNPTRAGAVVMCLSCHRAHGSDQPDMLRWDYGTMIAGTTGASAGTGCFRCHSSKDAQ